MGLAADIFYFVSTRIFYAVNSLTQNNGKPQGSTIAHKSANHTLSLFQTIYSREDRNNFDISRSSINYIDNSNYNIHTCHTDPEHSLETLPDTTSLPNSLTNLTYTDQRKDIIHHLNQFEQFNLNSSTPPSNFLNNLEFVKPVESSAEQNLGSKIRNPVKSKDSNRSNYNLTSSFRNLNKFFNRKLKLRRQSYDDLHTRTIFPKEELLNNASLRTRIHHKESLDLELKSPLYKATKYKLMLCGLENSGKTTLYNQLKSIYCSQPTVKPRHDHFRAQDLFFQNENLVESRSSENSKHDSVITRNDNRHVSSPNSNNSNYRTPGIQAGSIDTTQTYKNYNIHQPYKPTTKITDARLDKVGVRLYDIGGNQKSRRLWPFVFYNLDLILYVVDANTFCLNVESQAESLEIFGRLINNRYLRNVPFLVIFNKYDSLLKNLKFKDNVEKFKEIHNLKQLNYKIGNGMQNFQYNTSYFQPSDEEEDWIESTTADVTSSGIFKPLNSFSLPPEIKKSIDRITSWNSEKSKKFSSHSKINSKASSTRSRKPTERQKSLRSEQKLKIENLNLYKGDKLLKLDDIHQILQNHFLEFIDGQEEFNAKERTSLLESLNLNPIQKDEMKNFYDVKIENNQWKIDSTKKLKVRSDSHKSYSQPAIKKKHSLKKLLRQTKSLNFLNSSRKTSLESIGDKFFELPETPKIRFNLRVSDRYRIFLNQFSLFSCCLCKQMSIF